MAEKGETEDKSRSIWGQILIFNGICFIIISIISLIFMLNRTILTYLIAVVAFLFGIYSLIDGVLTLKRINSEETNPPKL
jgi:uncharacterized membrane protein